MYAHIFLGGTFDRLHKGHEAMLTRAFAVGDRVTIGLTSDLFVQKFRSQQDIPPFFERKKKIADWTASADYENRVTIIAIDDPYEPAASQGDLDAIMVTPDNRIRGEEINTRRVAKGLPVLTLVEVPLLAAEDSKIVSSTRVRNGEIDPAGRLILPDNLRPELVRPLGDVLIGDTVGTSIEKHRHDILVAVGDVTTKTLLTAGVFPSLIIIDGKVGRKDYADALDRLKTLETSTVRVKSGPGYIAGEAVEQIKKWSMHPTDKTVIVVTGEEDLLTLPAISEAPIGSVIYYGQPPEAAWACGPTMHAGMVEVVVTQEKKDEAAAILTKFESA